MIDSISKYNPACDRHCARCWEYRGTQCLSLNDIPPEKATVRRSMPDELDWALQPCSTPLIWCRHLLGIFSFTAFNQKAPVPISARGTSTFPHECTSPLPLHQHHGGTSPNSSRLASSLPAGVLSHLPGVPRASASFLSHGVLPLSFCLKVLVFGFLPLL